ncbi:MAG: chemotaxis-specific protein-glutamate methyltransferase CheB [Myxococcaceae bacterium]|nr:chemotaxis-specific protein-glutamate methyltransferase CheB [Myxococcaceae bacterium]MCA3013086.1 chemotaxis-specific protein-glutamate methyltransferase CheB [Myxococcaceae bacterium]
MALERPIRVLVIDDSPSNRRAITALLESAPGLEVVDRAADGEEGLKKAIALRPDCITLDLEMPRLDGFSLLRLLQARAPTPVIVLSSYGHPADVFKALQLGALDFVAKPAGNDAGALESVRAELIEKVRAAPLARRGPGYRVTDPLRTPHVPVRAAPRSSGGPAPLHGTAVVAIGASTGGPPAVQEVLEALGGLPVSVLVAQHMPSRFTEAFAQRLDGVLSFRVKEARDGEPVVPGRVYIAPGGEQLELWGHPDALVTRVLPPEPSDVYAPSVDRLFRSVAKATLGRARGVVLTGMGNDGGAGTRALLDAGAEVWVESEDTAVVFGMPQAAIANGPVTQVLPRHALGPALARAVAGGRDAPGAPSKK